MKKTELTDLPIYSFEPIANLQSKLLILGTMPGKESLKMSSYYAHPQNVFWKIMFTLFNLPYSTDYLIRREMLLTNGVALWDVLERCTRRSSLDTDIRTEYPNNITDFLVSHPDISHIFFNGKGAENYFRKYFPEVSLSKQVKPSTSAAHAKKWEEKLEIWKAIINIRKK